MIAICIGHSRKIKGRYDGGAYSPWLDITERNFNLQVASHLSKHLAQNGIPSQVINDYAGSGYGSAMQDAADQIKAMHASVAIELHFNSAFSGASGHEWLYWCSSAKGKALAQAFSAQFGKDHPDIKARGAKAITAQDRGGAFLRCTHCPSVILEPFFGSSQSDCQQITPESVAKSYAKALITHP
jgi:N-acetylmuramoyl-L-alanine amidase